MSGAADSNPGPRLPPGIIRQACGSGAARVPRVVGHDTARVEHDDALEAAEQIEIMGHQHDPLPQPLDQLHEPPLVPQVQQRCRLVADEHLGVEHEHRAEREQLLLRPPESWCAGWSA